MKHGSLFSGIGGFDLAAEWMGWENVFHCENNPYCQKILKQHFSNSILYEDIKTTDFTIHRGTINVLTGGFPCQPYSVAGKRLGTEDERHLWPQMLRAVREIQPPWVVGENVNGLVNWNGGMVFNEVQVDLENEGYEVQPVILPACGVNAPHKRERVWFIAYSHSNGYKLRGFTEDRSAKEESIREQKEWERIQDNGKVDGLECFGNAADPNSGIGCEGRMHTEKSKKAERYVSTFNSWDNKCRTWDNFPTQPPVCRRNDGIPNRMDRIKGLGNAIVPQIALQIFRVIDQIAVRQGDFKNF